MASDTPVAVVYSATTDHESVTRTTLAELPDIEVTNPSTLVIGPVAAQSVLPPELAPLDRHEPNQKEILR